MWPSHSAETENLTVWQGSPELRHQFLQKPMLIACKSGNNIKRVRFVSQTALPGYDSCLKERVSGFTTLPLMSHTWSGHNSRGVFPLMLNVATSYQFVRLGHTLHINWPEASCPYLRHWCGREAGMATIWFAFGEAHHRKAESSYPATSLTGRKRCAPC